MNKPVQLMVIPEDCFELSKKRGDKLNDPKRVIR